MSAKYCDIVYSADDATKTGRGWYVQAFDNGTTSPLFATETEARKYAEERAYTVAMVLR